MRLSINFDQQDEDTVRGITSVCDELGLRYSLEERDDWLSHALRPPSDDSTHMIFVISPATTTSWWLPFQIGRATERRMNILSYVKESTNVLPSYLDAVELVRGPQDLKSRLCRLLSTLKCNNPAG